jgi:hypothetical protein
VFENRVIRRMFLPKRDEVTGERRTLHNVELHNLYSMSMSDEVKENEAGGMQEERKVYKVLVGKINGRRRFGRPRHKSKWILWRLAGENGVDQVSSG